MQASSGARISVAGDNAAYWSISTTMRSDGRALSAVMDALGLGAAKVDVAYEGLEAAKDVVSVFRARLVAAKEQGVDRSKIQSELDQLKSQLLSIASSSSFNGVNWLNTVIPQYLPELSSLTSNIVSSFVRSPDSGVRVGTTAVDVAKLSLFNLGGGGALQKDIRSLGDIGGFRNAGINAAGERGYQDFQFLGPLNFTASDNITFTTEWDADSPTMSGPLPGTLVTAVIDLNVVTMAIGKSSIDTPAEMAHAVNYALTLANRAALVDSTGSTVRMISTRSDGEGSSVNVTAVTSTFAGPSAFGGLDQVQPTVFGLPVTESFGFTSPFRVHTDVSFSFDLHVDGRPPIELIVDRSLVDTVLGTTDGLIGSAQALADVLNAAVSGTDVQISASGNVVEFQMLQPPNRAVGGNSRIRIDGIEDNGGRGPDFDIVDVDIRDQNSNIDNYLSGIDVMLEKVISGAAAVGAVRNRIQMQEDFAAALSDQIESGVGRLVDADINEVSSRLKAVQVQQQLAVQSLSIANQTPQNILQLFQ